MHMTQSPAVVRNTELNVVMQRRIDDLSIQAITALALPKDMPDRSEVIEQYVVSHWPEKGTPWWQVSQWYRQRREQLRAAHHIQEGPSVPRRAYIDRQGVVLAVC